MHFPYTYYNCFLMILSLRFRFLLPYFLTNSATVLIGFHIPILLQPGFLDNLIKWNKVTPPIFWLGNFLVHGVPFIIALILYQQHQLDIIINPGIITGIFQFIWCKLCTKEGTFDLSKTYIYADLRVWILTWIFGISTHLIVGLCVSKNTFKLSKTSEKI